MVKNLELQQQELKPPEIFEEKQFAAAIGGKRIKDIPEIHLREAIRYCMLKVGLRGANFPEGAEKALLLNHIYENYGNHTPEEIRLAFDLALQAKLNLDTNDVKTFENFSCAYFSTIMNAYRVWAAQVYEQKQREQKTLLIEDKPDLEQIEREYQEFLKTDLAKKYKPNL